MSALGIGESVAVGLAAGLTGGAMMEWGTELPLLENLTVLQLMKGQALQASTVIALSAAAGNLLGRPAMRMVLPLLGITVAGA
jgi:hypothetical protein